MVILSHPIFLEHDTGPDHPECAQRLRNILAALGAAHVPWTHVAAPATVAELERAHSPEHVARVLALSGRAGLAGVEVPISPRSIEAALWAAGGAIEATDRAVSTGEEVWALVRPPGHHATRALSQGFCVFNNVAIAALHFLAGAPGRRVAVLDWDVHHGDGTQDILWGEPDAGYLSIHQYPLYPETGTAEEQGDHDNIVNIPLPSGSDDADYARVIEEVALPALDRLRPNLLLVSAGFDAQRGDPLAGMWVTPQGFARMASLVRAWAQESRVPVVFVLEGGYKVDTLAACVLAAMGVAP